MSTESRMTPDASTAGWHPLFRRPSTRLGWWSIALAVAFMVLSVVNSAVFMRLAADAPWRQTVLPVYGIVMMACGLVAGIVGLLAIVRQHERSLFVWLTLVFGLGVILLVLGEFLVPH
ncbi:MAG: hypothetical protein AB9886_01535 [Candidatus Cryosericum sp.]